MTNGDIVRRLYDVGMALLLSSIKHSADYESDDYDPLMLEWVQKKAEPGMVSLFEDQRLQTMHRYALGEDVPPGWYWVFQDGKKPVIIEFDDELRYNWKYKPSRVPMTAVGPIEESEVEGTPPKRSDALP